jgi:ABC-type sugar transport system substrate-binding protein
MKFISYQPRSKAHGRLAVSWEEKMKIKSLITALAAGMVLSTTAVKAEGNAFRCEPGEKYVMNVMVSGVEYWFPVYEMFKQAGQQMGCETEYTGTPEYDVNKQIASFDQVTGTEARPAFSSIR